MEDEKVNVTKIVNVAILDIRNAVNKDLGKVNMVNVGYILHTPETLDLLKAGKRVNVGQFVEANPEARVLLSPTTFTDEYFSQPDSALELLAFSPITVDWKTSAESIEQGLARLDIYGGPLICPRHLLSTLQSKIQHQDAETVVYESASARLSMGKLILDETFLGSLEDDTELLVIGTLKIPQVLPNELLKQKIKRLYVKGRIVCHEENAAMIQSFNGSVQPKIKIIPAGYELVEKPLVLNKMMLEGFPARKIYCTEWVQITTDVSADVLDQNLEAVIAEERLYCPEGLKETIARKCDWLKTNLELYVGELWIVEDQRQLPVFAFDHLDGVATLVVMGELELDPQITPETLTGRLNKVHNFGSICCTPEQMGALNAIPGVREGRLTDVTKPAKQVKDEPEVDVIQETYVNVNYLKL
jgi:hypothetical protein